MQPTADNRLAALPDGSALLPDLCSPYPVLALVVTVELFVVVIMLGAFGLDRFSWEFLAVTSFFAQWVVLSSAAILCQMRGWLNSMPPRRAVSVCFAVILAITFLLSLPGDWIVQGMPDQPVFEVLNWTSVARNLLIAALIAGMALRYLYVQAELRRHERAELESRIQALQSRIRPHFLFNSINSVASLIGSDPELAETVLEDLSELFRASLRDVVSEVPVREEIDLCRRYVRIESLRLGERLQVHWAIDGLPETTRIPMLTLQPLIENAIYHGIQPRPEGGEVEVRAESDGDRVRFTVSNPVTPSTTDTGGNRMAMRNIEDRIKALYGPEARFEVRRTDTQFTVELEYRPSRSGEVAE